MLRRAGHGPWHDDAFEFVEFAVQPSMQRRGIGTALITRMLEMIPHRHVLLSTAPAEDNQATHLYRHVGFVDLLEHYRYPGSEEPARIMGLGR